MKNQRLKLARVAADLTQGELAEKIGVTRQTISLIEQGKYNPSLNLCLALCYVLNKSLDELFWREKEDEE
jgi:putative transcriptional regulator